MQKQKRRVYVRVQVYSVMYLVYFADYVKANFAVYCYLENNRKAKCKGKTPMFVAYPNTAYR